jgi:hypothetical protein
VFSSASGTDAWAGWFDGVVKINGVTYPSDEKLKQDIADMDPAGSLDQLMRLRPTSYRYRTDQYPDMNLPAEDQMGLVAQDLQQVFPELVKQVTPPPEDDEEQDTAGAGREPFLGIDYNGLIPVLIAAVQQQQWEIEELRAQVASLSRKK